MNSWTPGPWKADNGIIISVDSSGAIVGDDIATVAWGSEANNGTLEARANARLIAAAPDLYEKLQALFLACDDATSGSPMEWAQWQNDFDGYLITAQAALAKARGETTE